MIFFNVSENTIANSKVENMDIFKSSQFSACPACLSPHIKLWMVKEKYNIQFIIFKCLKCQTGFLNPQPLKTYLQSIYTFSGHGLAKEISFQEVWESEKQYPNATIDAKRIVFYAKQLLIKKNSFNNLKALDIGSGYGFFTNAAIKEGFSVKAINPGIWENRVFEEMHGFSPIHEYFEDVNFGTEKIDLVILSQVLEHIDNPRQFLEKIRSILHPWGVLALAVPNVDSFFVKILNQKESGCLWIPEHLFYYSKKGLLSLLDGSGFSISRHMSVSRLPNNIISKRLILNDHLQKLVDLTTKVVQVFPLKIFDLWGIGIMHNVWAQPKG